MMSKHINPTVGRVVLVFFAAAASGAMEGFSLPTDEFTPVPGLIARVHENGTINVAAFDANGENLPLMNVQLLQDGDERPASGCWAEWMPYQKEQAAKTGQAAQVCQADLQALRQRALEMASSLPSITKPAQLVEAAETLLQFILTGPKAAE